MITIAPSSAVPSEEPSCCAVFCSPPASLRSSSPTEDWTTLPSWETTRPMPTPSTPIAARNGRVVEIRLDRAQSISVETKTIAEPDADEGRGREAGRQRRPGDRGDEEPDRGGQHPHPGLERVEAVDDLEKERDREEDPHQDQVLREQHPSAAAQRGDLEAAEVDQRVERLRSSRRRSQARKPARTTAPAAITNGVSEKPNGSTGELSG